jgi:hypothetical protein
MFMKSIYLFAAFTFAEKCAVTTLRENISETETTIKALATELEQEQCRLLDEYKSELKAVNDRIATAKCEMASQLQTSKLKLHHLEDAMRVIASTSEQHTAVLTEYKLDIKKVRDAKAAEAELKKCAIDITALEDKQREIQNITELSLKMIKDSIANTQNNAGRRRGAALVSRRGDETGEGDLGMDVAESDADTQVAVLEEPCMKTKMMHVGVGFLFGFVISYVIFNVFMGDDTPKPVKPAAQFNYSIFVDGQYCGARVEMETINGRLNLQAACNDDTQCVGFDYSTATGNGKLCLSFDNPVETSYMIIYKKPTQVSCTPDDAFSCTDQERCANDTNGACMAADTCTCVPLARRLSQRKLSSRRWR